jgi:hypothetical protein
MKISTNITFAEATNSATAKRLGLANQPNDVQLENMRAVAVNVFEKLRAGLGGKPIKVTSFFRSEASNKAVGGSTSSQHCKGEAMDLVKASEIAEIFFFIKDELLFDQLIWEFGDAFNPAWVHVSFSKGKNRGQILRAKKLHGATVYETYR